MASTITMTGAPAREVLVVRFTAAERAAHWVHAAAFVVLLATGIILYVPAFRAYTTSAAGEVSRTVHRLGAVAFMLAPVLYLVFSPREFFYSLKEAFTWGRDDSEWFRNAWSYYTNGVAGTMPAQGKYNSGQKFNALTQIVSFVLFVVTGLIMWFGKGVVPREVFLVSVIVHDLSVIATVLLFMLHLYLVAIHPMMRESITAMFEGTVSEAFAKEHHGKWLTTRVYHKHQQDTGRNS